MTKRHGSESVENLSKNPYTDKARTRHVPTSKRANTPEVHD